MKFEEALPLMRQGKKGYLVKSCYTHWEGKETYFLQYFESMDDFHTKYPHTRLSMPSELPHGSFLACFWNSIYGGYEFEEDDLGPGKEVPKEHYYNNYRNAPHKTIALHEDGMIELIQLETKDTDDEEDEEFVYLNHRDKCSMGDYYGNPAKMNYDFFFYSDVMMGSDWDVFD